MTATTKSVPYLEAFMQTLEPRLRPLVLAELQRRAKGLVPLTPPKGFVYKAKPEPNADD